MRPSFALQAIRPLPLSSVPENLIRLPPKAALKRSKLSASAASPTIDRLMANLAKRAASVEAKVEAKSALPPNLRIDQFVPKRSEYAGVGKLPRNLLQRLRREN